MRILVCIVFLLFGTGLLLAVTGYSVIGIVLIGNSLPLFLIGTLMRTANKPAAGAYLPSPISPGVIYEKQKKFSRRTKLGLALLFLLFLDMACTGSREIFPVFLIASMLTIFCVGMDWLEQCVPIDRLLDCGNYLMLEKAGKTEQIPLAEIDRVVFSLRTVRFFFGFPFFSHYRLSLFRTGELLRDTPGERWRFSFRNLDCWIVRFYFQQPGTFGQMLECKAHPTSRESKPPFWAESLGARLRRNALLSP
ncbi:MAG: hypothetical protein LBO00_01495 [Zoogloeaceae bacterium]|jgi:hypothetical protein|nr:hypothetical protein [Zoogloeaceae bacterium]